MRGTREQKNMGNREHDKKTFSSVLEEKGETYSFQGNKGIYTPFPHPKEDPFNEDEAEANISINRESMIETQNLSSVLVY